MDGYVMQAVKHFPELQSLSEVQKHGAIAGLDGHYTFNIPAQEGLILTYSFIGMEKKTVRYTGKEND